MARPISTLLRFRAPSKTLISAVCRPNDSLRDNGTGIRLAIVRRAVERHGGEVLLDSEIGKGTTVTIVLPAMSPETAESQNAPGSADR